MKKIKNPNRNRTIVIFKPQTGNDDAAELRRFKPSSSIKIILGSDHAGFKLKEKIKLFLQREKISYEDLGTFSEKKVDYPDFVIPVAEKVVKEKNCFGIILGGSGEGEAIAANKVKGARVVVIYNFDKKLIQLTKKHNDANILSLGARFLSEKEAVEAVELWIKTKFSNEKN